MLGIGSSILNFLFIVQNNIKILLNKYVSILLCTVNKIKLNILKKQNPFEINSKGFIYFFIGD